MRVVSELLIATWEEQLTSAFTGFTGPFLNDIRGPLPGKLSCGSFSEPLPVIFENNDIYNVNNVYDDSMQCVLSSKGVAELTMFVGVTLEQPRISHLSPPVWRAFRVVYTYCSMTMYVFVIMRLVTKPQYTHTKVWLTQNSPLYSGSPS